MIDFLLDRLPFPILRWLNNLCDDEPKIVHPPPREFVSHYIFDTQTGTVYQVRLVKDQDPEIYGSLHSPEICAEQGGACR